MHGDNDLTASGVRGMGEVEGHKVSGGKRPVQKRRSCRPDLTVMTEVALRPTHLSKRKEVIGKGLFH